jgi:hypothetical protein
MRSIPTKHAGLNMRLRLEARWAEVFTQLGWNWIYEPLDFNGWIPDFVIDHGFKPLLVDVKPYTSFGEDDELNVKIRRALGHDLNRYNLSVTRAYPVENPYHVCHVGWISGFRRSVATLGRCGNYADQEGRH